MSIAKISADQIKDIVVDSGMILKSFTPSANPTVLASDILMCTKGGVSPSCIPQFEDFGSDIDNCPDNAKEMKRITGWEVSLETTALNIDEATVRLSLGAADYDSSTKKITPRSNINLGTDANNDGDYEDEGDTPPDFKDFWFLGLIAGGGFLAIKIKNALNTSGFVIKTTKKGKGEVAIKLEGHPSVSDNGLVCPMEFYIY